MIELTHDGDVDAPDHWPQERCCFCRKPTRYWFTPKDVACCQECAKRAEPEDVPTKDVWFKRERIANGRLK
jgi:hypothetical protein